jgi:hypothetical protein
MLVARKRFRRFQNAKTVKFPPVIVSGPMFVVLVFQHWTLLLMKHIERMKTGQLVRGLIGSPHIVTRAVWKNIPKLLQLILQLFGSQSDAPINI